MFRFARVTRCCVLATLLVFAQSAAAAGLPRDVNAAEHAAAAVLDALDAPLRSPLPGKVISSGFGWRHHPVLKRTRFHAGIDYRAPSGTPVLAAGEGVIERIERHRDRGLYVVIRHAGSVHSGYAHLSALTPGLAVGQRVETHQPIAHVGRSGRTSGAHLDFEVFHGGLRVDPERVLAVGGYDAMPAEHESSGNNFGSGKLVTFD